MHTHPELNPPDQRRVRYLHSLTWSCPSVRRLPDSSMSASRPDIPSLARFVLLMLSAHTEKFRTVLFAQEQILITCNVKICHLAHMAHETIAVTRCRRIRSTTSVGIGAMFNSQHDRTRSVAIVIHVQIDVSLLDPMQPSKENRPQYFSFIAHVGWHTSA